MEALFCIFLIVTLMECSNVHAKISHNITNLGNAGRVGDAMPVGDGSDGNNLYGAKKTDSGGCKTKSGKKCVFPFTYKSVKYSDCSTVDNHKQPWCATETDAKGNEITGQWGNCDALCTECKTKSGKKCVFPFTYKSVKYSDCSTANNVGTPWCATETDSKGNYIGNWGNCDAFCKGCKTVGGKRCVFPFTYTFGFQTQTFLECATVNSYGKHWCATETGLQGGFIKNKWGYCDAFCREKECETTVTGSKCVFPFKYNSVWYSQCSNANNGGKPWCATSVDASGEYHEWETCPRQCGGCTTSVSGKKCRIPFEYNSVSYSQCTQAEVDGHRKGETWCYLESGKWDYCPNYCSDHGQPEQVHLAWLGDATQMCITWVTYSIVKESMVEFGEIKLTKTAKATIRTFVNGESENRKEYIYNACMTGLKPKTQYRYHVGSQRSWSDTFWFKSLSDGTDWAPRIAVFGDLGYYGGISIDPLQKESQKGHFDLLWHVGDIAYQLNYDNGRTGDAFMRLMEPATAYVPYQVVSGNHEHPYNFSDYKARFSMPKNSGGENMFYSYDVGPAHVVVYSTEFYYYTNFGTMQIGNQYRWLKKDLMKASLPENRAKRPWIITLGHKPMYCSNSDDWPCFKGHGEGYELVRKGLYGLEDLFYNHSVDLNIAGHEHSYERFWPVYNREVFNGSSKSNPYDNPGATVHITSGSAGMGDDPHDPFMEMVKKWSAFRNLDFGYGHLNILNKTHIYWEQISAKMGQVDKIMLIKNECNFGLCANNKVFNARRRRSSVTEAATRTMRTQSGKEDIPEKLTKAPLNNHMDNKVAV